MKLITIALILCIQQGISAQKISIMETTNSKEAISTFFSEISMGNHMQRHGMTI